ncbi:MAG: cyclohydrolase [Bacteroidota bacterium]|jgi:GTP cyclohydrolase IA
MKFNDLIANQHVHEKKHVNSSNFNNAIREDAFDISTEEKIETISKHFKSILHTLGMDLNDESLRDTPSRVAKMYVNEIFGGLLPENFPDITLFENQYQYNQVLIEKNITLYSTCEHHLVPIIGKAHVGYISNGKVIGLSKINRIVQYFGRRPQVQERLTVQIAECLQRILDTPHIAVVIEADHLCVASRGIKDTSSTTITSHFIGKFLNDNNRNAFMSAIK